jgi:hypothetical protein
MTSTTKDYPSRKAPTKTSTVSHSQTVSQVVKIKDYPLKVIKNLKSQGINTQTFLFNLISKTYNQ